MEGAGCRYISLQWKRLSHPGGLLLNFLVSQLNRLMDTTVISAMKANFSCHGMPEEVFTDNVPFGGAEIKDFGHKWGVMFTTSAPIYPQSNGQAERAIQTMKRALRKAHEDGTDIQLAILAYRNSPNCGMKLSPAQLLKNRRLRDKLPASG